MGTDSTSTSNRELLGRYTSISHRRGNGRHQESGKVHKPFQNDQRRVLTAMKGGVITHEYSIIKGFAAKASEKILDTVQALGTAHNCKVEADQIVGTQ